jgi:hypothetical protein
MAEQHIAIFKEIGLPQDVIDKIEGVTPETLKDFKPGDYTGIINTNFENRFLNDAGFLGKIPVDKIPETARKALEKGQYERFLNEMGDVAKELGIGIDDLTDDVKRSIKQFYRTTTQRYGEKKGATTETVTKLQNDLQIAMQQKAAAEEGANGKITEAVKATTTKYLSVLQKLAGQTVLASIEGLTAKPEYIIDGLMNKIGNKFSIAFDENTLGFVLMQKENPQLKALDAKGNEISFTDAAVDILTNDKMIVKKADDNDDDAGDGKTQKIIIGDAKNGVFVAGSDKIKKQWNRKRKTK